MITKNVKLYLGDGFPVRIPVSQFDTMWQFVFEIIHNSQPWQIPTGATAVLNGKKPDGNVFAFSGTIANNAVTVDADVQMTAVAGQTVCELSIIADGKTVGTANFVLDVEEAPKSADDVVSDTVLDGYGMMVTNAVDDYIERHPEVFGGDKFTQSAKNALLTLLRKVAYIDENGQTYIDALESELFPPASIVSITAVFNQGQNVIYDTDSLDVLKQYLTVTANYDDSTTETVTDYVLSGTLAEGTSTITVSYGGKTTTFNVTVTHWDIPSEYQKVEYIGTTGTQYIMTDIVTTNSNRREYDFDIDFKFDEWNSASPTNIVAGLGSEAGFWIGYLNSVQKIGLGGNSGNYFTTGTITDRHSYTVRIEKETDGLTTCTRDDGATVTRTSQTDPVDQERTFALFAFYASATNMYRFTGKIYSCTVYHNGVTYRNYVPCYRISDGVIGMYETETGTFLTNSGTGTFTKGGDVA